MEPKIQTFMFCFCPFCMYEAIMSDLSVFCYAFMPCSICAIKRNKLTVQAYACLLKSKSYCAQSGLLAGKCIELQPNSPILKLAAPEVSSGEGDFCPFPQGKPQAPHWSFSSVPTILFRIWWNHNCISQLCTTLNSKKFFHNSYFRFYI